MENKQMVKINHLLLLFCIIPMVFIPAWHWGYFSAAHEWLPQVSEKAHCEKKLNIFFVKATQLIITYSPSPWLCCLDACQVLGYLAIGHIRNTTSIQIDQRTRSDSKDKAENIPLPKWNRFPTHTELSGTHWQMWSSASVLCFQWVPPQIETNHNLWLCISVTLLVSHSPEWNVSTKAA